MPINIIDNFSVNISKPIDTRIIASNSAVRLAIPYKYDGLTVVQLDDRKTYTWNSGTSTWDVSVSGLGATGYAPIYNSVNTLTPGIIYQSDSNNIGFSTSDPKANFQISGTFLGCVQPLTINVGSIDSKFSYNYYNNGTDNVFDLTKGSARMIFTDNGDFTIGLRNPNDVAGAFYNPLYLSAGNTTLSNNNNLNIVGSTVSISSNITNITHGSSGYVFISASPSHGGAIQTIVGPVVSTFSISTINDPTYLLYAQTNMLLRTADGVFGNPASGSNIYLTSGNGFNFFLDGYGGSVEISGGYGSAFFANGWGGDVKLIGGDGQNYGGNISIRAGTNGSLRGYIELGINRLWIEDNDIYSYVHNKGTAGIGNSGNSATPWNYPSLASGQYSMVIGDISDTTNVTSVVPGPAAWMRVGNVISVSGQISLSVTTANVVSTFKVKIPISSDFGNDLGGGNGNNWQLNGTAKIVGLYGAGDICSIQAYDIASHTSTSAKAHFRFKPSTTGVQIIVYHYQYIVGNYPDTPAGPPSPPTP